MFDDFRIFCVGVAVVIDTALLLTLLDRRNWRNLVMPIALLALGGWLFHAGSFIHLLLTDAAGRWSPGANWVAGMAICLGLLLMPSALVHGTLRLWETGFETERPSRWRRAALYLPVVALIPAGAWLRNASGGDFLVDVAPFVVPFTFWCIAANVGSAWALLLLRGRFTQPVNRRFLSWTAGVLFFVGALTSLIFVVHQGIWPAGAPAIVLAVTVAPLLPALVFAFFIIRYNFMRLMLEQTLVYGAIVVGVLLFHGLIVGDLTDTLAQRYGFDFGVVEGLLIIVLVLAYRPLRERTSEALRYLMGSRVSDVRQRSRQLAVELTRRVEDDPQQLLQWFVASLTRTLSVDYVAGWLFPNQGETLFVCSSQPPVDADVGRIILSDMQRHQIAACTRHTAPHAELLDRLKDCSAVLAVSLADDQCPGIFLIGRRGTAAALGDEEINAVVLLVEQFGVTLQNRALREKAFGAERRALENEKLSTLGLLASCLAHEVKNPLSSIKTIATVLSEQLGPQHEHREDLEMILAEVDRLASSTDELLGFARPAERGKPCRSLAEVVQRSVRFLGHQARRQGVEVQTELDAAPLALSADENAIREILLNLLSNSIDAAGSGGRVQVACRRNGQFAVTTFTDDGPGIAPDVQDRLFEPFATTKEKGTGLGLYIVSRRVHELGGEIQCETAAGRGTTFTVKLPLA